MKQSEKAASDQYEIEVVLADFEVMKLQRPKTSSRPHVIFLTDKNRRVVAFRSMFIDQPVTDTKLKPCLKETIEKFFRDLNP